MRRNKVRVINGICYGWIMLVSRLRLYTKNISYLRLALGGVGVQRRDVVSRAEQLIAATTGAKHAILTSMGRMAMFEGLQAIGRKGEIILSPITVPEVISLLHIAGFTPVFCDVEPGTWNLDVTKAEALVNDNTVAIMATYFYGDTAIALPVRALCDKHQLIMIEDAAQALGAYQGGQHAGTFGDFAILSFSYPKNVTSFYGGALLTNHYDIAASARAAIATYRPVNKGWLYKKVMACAIKDIGTWPPLFQISARIIRYGYRHNIQGIISIVSQNLNPEFFDTIPAAYLTRISSAQAMAIVDKWAEVDADTAHRISCAEIYHHALSGVPGILCAGLRVDRSHGYLYFPVQVADKYALQDYMIARGCDVAVQHAPNCADLPTYARYYRDCPLARAACHGTLMLPTYPGFPLEQAARYAAVIREYLHG